MLSHSPEQQPDDVLRQQADRCKKWLSESVLPLWGNIGFNSKTGNFEEGLLTQQQPYDDILRFRVQPRQVYVFSHASELGWYDGERIVRKSVSEGFSRFQDHEERFIFSIDRSSSRKKTDIFAYEHAFALLGYAWHYRLTRLDSSAVIAERYYLWFERELRDSVNGGFHSSFPPMEPRSQNPHMHLFEALMTWYEVSGEKVWLKRASKIYRLFSERFLEESFLREFFSENLQPTHDQSPNVDPGHHYEWVWLLHHYSKLTGVDTSDQMKVLLMFATRYGHAPTGLVYDEIKTSGQVLRNTSRLWCQTEYVKALVAIYESEPTKANKGNLVAAVKLIFKYYIEPAEEGLWIDQVYVDGKSVSTKSPASTLYHIFLAFSEVSRIAK